MNRAMICSVGVVPLSRVVRKPPVEFKTEDRGVAKS